MGRMFKQRLRVIISATRYHQRTSTIVTNYNATYNNDDDDDDDASDVMNCPRLFVG